MQDRDKYWDCLDQAMEASSGGRVDEALAWLDEALRANPMGAEAHNGRGEILWDHGRSEEALQEFDRAATANGSYHPARLNRIEILIEEFGDYERALELADELLGDPLDAQTEAETYYLKAKALFYLDDLEGALFLLRRAIKTQGEVAIYRGFEGQILFELGHLDEAERALKRSLSLEPDCAHSLYHMALVLEHRAQLEQAERLFAQAASVAPEMYPLPVRMELDEFERVADQAVQSLPRKVRGYVGHCPILIEDLPSLELVAAENISPQVLGLFMGLPATAPGASPTLGTAQRLDVDRIVLFKRNLEKVAATRDELVEQIQITVKHEIAHYLGMDEEEVERLGLA
jgi:predicted Zn-dependent protease with MMP-like domain/Flp pilus assembly protein TadD